MYSETLVITPLYLTIILSTFFSIIFGIIFKDMLEYQVSLWTLSTQPQARINYKTPNIIIAYCATTLLVLLCVGSSLTVFLQLYGLAAIISVIVVLPTALLIWVQLGSMLNLWSVKGLEAVDLETIFAPPQERSTEVMPSEGEIS